MEQLWVERPVPGVRRGDLATCVGSQVQPIVKHAPLDVPAILQVQKLMRLAKSVPLGSMPLRQVPHAQSVAH